MQIPEDSLYNYLYEGKNIQFISVSQNRFEQLTGSHYWERDLCEWCYDTTEKIVQENCTRLVLKNGDTLTFKVDTLQYRYKIKSESDATTYEYESEKIERYNFYAFNTYETFWFVECIYNEYLRELDEELPLYELTEYEIINKKTAEITKVCGYPFSTYDKKHILFYFSDIYGSTSYFTLQMFDISNTENLIKKWEIKQETWSLEGIYRTDDNQFIIKVLIPSPVYNAKTLKYLKLG